MAISLRRVRFSCDPRYDANIDNPYPTEHEAQLMAQQGAITARQVKAWFANKRTRLFNTRPKRQLLMTQGDLDGLSNQQLMSDAQALMQTIDTCQDQEAAMIPDMLRYQADNVQQFLAEQQHTEPWPILQSEESECSSSFESSIDFQTLNVKNEPSSTGDPSAFPRPYSPHAEGDELVKDYEHVVETYGSFSSGMQYSKPTYTEDANPIQAKKQMPAHPGTPTPEEPVSAVCEWLSEDTGETCARLCASLSKLVSHIRVDHVESGSASRHHICLWKDCTRKAVPFRARYKLMNHIRTHTGERPFTCPHNRCNKVFAYNENLKCHIRVHTGEKPFPCWITGCYRRFANCSDRRKHQLTHFDVKAFRCRVPGCNKAYTHPSSLRKHVIACRRRGGHQYIHQFVQPDVPFQCKIEPVFDDIKTVRPVAPSGDNPASDEFIHSQEYYTSRNVPVERASAPVPQLCQKPFVTQQGDLDKLTVAHTGQKPYQCTICLTGFSSTSNLAQHTKTHSGVTHHCEVCKKSFSQRRYLKWHNLRIHKKRWT